MPSTGNLYFVPVKIEKYVEYALRLVIFMYTPTSAEVIIQTYSSLNPNLIFK